MFGLLKSRTLNGEDYSNFRLNYCGTCKTLGKLYGHKERLLLNYDIVFLSELLACLSSKKEDFKYIIPNSCMTLPKSEGNIPDFLKYTASINILLGHYKIVDNIIDSNFRYSIWTLIKKSLTSNYKKAKHYLSKINFPTQTIDGFINEQFKREKELLSFDFFDITLKYYSSPTANITSIVFEHGVLLYQNKELSKCFSEIGSKFGEIVYLVDAIEDYKKDKQHKRFNIFLLPNYKDKNELINEARNYIYNCLGRVKILIEKLPISDSDKKRFISTLYLNLSNKLVISKKTCTSNYCSKKRLSIKERYKLAIANSRNISQKRNSLFLKYFSFMLLASLFITVFTLFPQLAYSTGDTLKKADCCSAISEFNCGKCGDGHFCGNCCQTCCCSCCPGNDSEKSFCRDIGDKCQQMPCFGCCVGALILGAFGGAASQAPKVIVKIIRIPTKVCCRD